MPPKKRANKSHKVEDQSKKVIYRLFAGGKHLHEVATLQEFLVVAVSQRWLILQDVEQKPARVWCPFLQPTLLEHGELARELRETEQLDKLVVADMSRAELKPLQESCVQAESAFVNMLKLVEGEEKAGAFSKGREAKKRQSAAVAGFIKEDEDLQMLEQGFDQVTDVVEKGETLNLEVQTHKEDSSTRQCDTQEDLFFEHGKIVYEGKELSSLEMLARLLKGVDNLNTTMVGLKDDVKDLKHAVKEVKDDVKDLNKSLSVVAERLSRRSLSLLYAHCTGAKVLYPVTARWMPYDPKSMGTEALEGLAWLYAKHPEDTSSRGSSGLVEIDVLIKIRKEEVEHKVYASPMMVKTSRLPSNEFDPFTHVVVGEYTRSLKLCASAEAYWHPEHPCRTPSSKLLKKLVQVERGIVATMFYYDAAGHSGSVDAAALVSPSFKQLNDPDSLLRKVLSYTYGALPNVSRLAREHRLWLIDV